MSYRAISDFGVPGHDCGATRTAGMEDTRHWPVVAGEMDGAVAKQIDQFARAIAGDAGMRATVGDGYRAHRVAEAIRLAIDRGERLALSDVPG